MTWEAPAQLREKQVRGKGKCALGLSQPGPQQASWLLVTCKSLSEHKLSDLPGVEIKNLEITFPVSQPSSHNNSDFSAGKVDTSAH